MLSHIAIHRVNCHPLKEKTYSNRRAEQTSLRSKIVYPKGGRKIRRLRTIPPIKIENRRAEINGYRFTVYGLLDFLGARSKRQGARGLFNFELSTY